MIETPLRADFRIGYLGAGQLARMSAVEAFRFGLQIAAYTDREGMEPVDYMTPYAETGGFDDLDKLVSFAEQCDILTLENEFLDASILHKVQQKSGTPIYPSPEAFRKIENKLIEKQTFEDAGIDVTPYRLVDSEEELREFGDEYGWPVMLKSSKGGYDGYGNETAESLEEAVEAYKKLGGEAGHDILAEAFIPFRKELAVQVARNQYGTEVYPCCETVQENHINTAVISPAPIDPDLRARAEKMAEAASEALDVRGLMAYEFFLTDDEEILLNESAPRPHNSGHYTIEGCIASQFENHVRSVAGLPLGSSEMRRPVAVMMNLLGDHDRNAQVDNAETALQLSDGHLHIYGKRQSRVGRKMGHFTLLGDEFDATYTQAEKRAQRIDI